MVIIFSDFCEKCKRRRNFSQYDTKNLCSKIHLFGFSFFGGIKFYTYREVLVFFGIKKQACVGECADCSTVYIKCPYCKEIIEKDIALNEKCPFCHKYFYICV